MRAWYLSKTSPVEPGSVPLDWVDVPIPQPGEGQVLIEVSTCGVCHTELDEIEGRTPPPQYPVIPGHQVVGRIIRVGPRVTNLTEGDRVGVAWIFSACGKCPACLAGQENLCPDFQATGRDAPGGYAEYMVAREAFCYPIPSEISDLEAAPLLCSGAIGYRSLKLANLPDGQPLGLAGFGASAHLVLKLAKYLFPNSPIFVFSRSQPEREFALHLSADWGGEIGEISPRPCAAIIDTTPAWKPVVEALANLQPGGRLVINAIRKESRDQNYLLNLDYPRHLWLEKEIKSVANLTRQDAAEFLALAASIPIRPEVQEYRLEDANQALIDLKNRQIRGAKVLVIMQ